MWDRMSVSQSLLGRTWFESDDKYQMQIVVPTNRYKDLVHYFHDLPSGGHLGADKTLNKVRQTFYWPGIKEYVEKYFLQCTKSAARKTSKPGKSPLGNSVV